MSEWLCFPHFQEHRFVVAGKQSAGAGPGNECAGLVPEHVGRGGPVNGRILAGDFASVGSGLVGLGAGLDAVFAEAGDGLDQQARSDLSEAMVQGLGVVGIEDGSGASGEDVAGVEALVNPHDGYAGL